MKNNTSNWPVVNWIFVVVFFALGILNIIFVHIVPGIIYLLLAFFYIPQTANFLKRSMGFSIPPLVKILLGLVILWGTLAVGDLMEIFESWWLT